MRLCRLDTLPSFTLTEATSATAERQTVRVTEPLTSGLFLGARIAAGGEAFSVSIIDLTRHPVGPSWFVVVALTLVTGWSMLRMRDVPISFSISDTFTIAAALLFGPAAGTVTVVVDALVMSLRVA